MAQYWQSKMLFAKTGANNGGGMTAMMNKQMLYFMPIITIVIGASLPAGLTMYWFFTTLFSIVQQYFILKTTKKSAN